jgi:hypothetical protein
MKNKVKTVLNSLAEESTITKELFVEGLGERIVLLEVEVSDSSSPTNFYPPLINYQGTIFVQVSVFPHRNPCV